MDNELKLKKVLKILKILILLGIMLYVLGISYIISHEQIHKQIFSRYDIKSEVKINKLTLSGVTTPNNLTNCLDSCKSQHNLNDVVGYNLIVFIMSLWFMLIFYLAYRRTYESKD